MNLPPFIGSDVAIGSGTLQVGVPGTRPGDIVIFAAAFRNSAPAQRPTGGTRFHTLLRVDTSSNEWHCVWWKFAGAEPDVWSLTQSASGAAGVLVIRPDPPVGPPLFRGAVNDDGYTPAMYVPKDGLYVGVWLGSYANTLPIPDGQDHRVSVQQGSDEYVVMGVTPTPGGRTVGPIGTHNTIAHGTYQSEWALVFPPVARGPDSDIRSVP